MERDDFIRSINAESAALAAAARTAGPNAPVPTCPEWMVAKLVKHTGIAQRWASTVLETGAPVTPQSIDLGLPADEAAYPDWLEQSASALVDRIRVTDPDLPCWSWGTDQHARFWSRRMAHEAVIHRCDAQIAAGDSPTPIAAGVAIDGLDELFDNVPVHGGLQGIRGNGESVHLHATDGDGEWLVQCTSDGLVIRREHAKGDVAVRGSASDLLLFVLGRGPDTNLEIFGDTQALAAWRVQMAF